MGNNRSCSLGDWYHSLGEMLRKFKKQAWPNYPLTALNAAQSLGEWHRSLGEWSGFPPKNSNFKFFFFLVKESRWASLCAQRVAPGAKIRSNWTKDFVGAGVMLAGRVGASWASLHNFGTVFLWKTRLAKLVVTRWASSGRPDAPKN